MSEVAEKLSFQAEVKQLLKIVVHSLYSNKEIFLRELISNAADASDKLRFLALSQPDLYEANTELAIRISYDDNAKTLQISDDGIGMTREEVINNIGTIAKSGTLEFLAQLSGDQKKDAQLIGQFGVGFYSAFMVADKVTVITRKAGVPAEQGVQWESSGGGEYLIQSVNKAKRGTDIILHLKATDENFLNAWQLRSIITKYSDHLTIPIYMPQYNEDAKADTTWEIVNQAKTFWTQPKSKLTDDDYQNFYKQNFHDIEPSLAWTHHKIEGNLEYLSLLYVPQKAPLDLFQRDQHQGLKLYVNRVFIMDHVQQFLPHYLRFVRGILDTTAIPLNISREILQEHPTLPKLRSAMTRHVLDLLESLANDQPEHYASFWREFGAVLKEGPAEDFTNRKRIAALFRFHSTQALSEPTVSFAEYIQRMGEKQKKIYYITAENLNAAQASPHLEIFIKNKIEVLLLTDRIDEWFIAHLAEYEDKPLQSVLKGDLEFNEVEPDTKVDKNKEAEHQQTYAMLLKKIETFLAHKVKEVRLSKRLTASPACLVRDQNALGPQMEKLMKATGQSISESKPILELNPDHSIVRQLQEKMLNNDEALREWTFILHDQALLAEGGELTDPAAFVNRLNRMWVTMLS